MVRLSKFLCLKVNCYNTITSILSHNNNFSIFVWCQCFDDFGLLECNLTWLVIINNGNSCSWVLAVQWVSSFSIDQLDEKVSIWLPVVIVLDNNFNETWSFSFEFQSSINSFEVLSSSGLSIFSDDSNICCSSLFIYNDNFECSWSLTNGVVETFESEELILLLIINMVGVSMLLLQDLSLANLWSLSEHHTSNLFSIFNSWNHVVTLNSFFQIIKLNGFNFVSFELFLNERSHFITLLLVVNFSLLFIDQSSIDFHCSVLNNSLFLFLWLSR